MRKRLLGVLVAGSLAAAMLGVGTANAAASDASLNVVHGIPGVDVNVCVNGTEAISDFSFGDVVTGVALPDGVYTFKIVAATDACTASGILVAADVDLMAGKDYTAIAYLKADGTPTLGLYKNNVKPVAKGTARLIVRHNAAAPAVDVWANGAPLVTDFANGDSATAIVPKGVYAAWVSLPGDYQPVIGPAVLKLAKGTAYQVYAIGDGTSGYTFAVVATEVGVK
jgi:Domain of unknown function (DUF4397)